MKLLSDTKELLTFIWRDIERKHLHVVAAGIAYYSLISFFPAVLLLAAVLAYLPLQVSAQTASSFMGYVMPPQGVSMMEGILSTVTPHRRGLLSIGLITTLWAASIGIKGIIAGLDIVYAVRVPRSIWINRLLAFGLALAVGILFLIGILLTLIGPLFENALAATGSLQSLWVRFWPFLQWSLSAIATFAAIELLYLFAPNVPALRRTTVPGAMIAALSALVLSWGLSFYIYHFGAWKFEQLYGALTAPVVMLIYLNWGAFAILVGAVINLNLQLLKSRRASTQRPEAA